MNILRCCVRICNIKIFDDFPIFAILLLSFLTSHRNGRRIITSDKIQIHNNVNAGAVAIQSRCYRLSGIIAFIAKADVAEATSLRRESYVFIRVPRRIPINLVVCITLKSSPFLGRAVMCFVTF